MALELFKPFVMKRLVDLGLAQNIKSAKRMVERSRHSLGRSRRGNQGATSSVEPCADSSPPRYSGIEPVLVEGKAINFTHLFVLRSTLTLMVTRWLSTFRYR